MHNLLWSESFFAVDLKPKPAKLISADEFAEHLGRVRAWIRARDALFEVTERLLDRNRPS